MTSSVAPSGICRVARNPDGICAAHAEIVGVDDSGVPAEFVRGKCHRNGGSNDVATSEIDDSGVLTDASADHYTWIVRPLNTKKGLH